MMLVTGTKLGRYEIRSQLGAGGMGEVYRARDTQLGRDVAIKVIASSVAVDKDRLRRFEQEACAAGALNHPNILVVHDIAAHDGSPYVVSELLEGETLRQRIAGAPLNQRRAIEYALQIANGLAAAHEKGIIHRDLKPDNIFITNDGRVKILDFGLAKLMEADGNHVLADAPTRRIDTNSGVVVGTVGYMSPEQLKGRVVDQRSDIFAFGAILYEMLSGRRAFHGESPAETMSAILKEDPLELSQTNQNVSPALERLVNRCLEKNPESRFHSASDLAFALDALSGSASSIDKTISVTTLGLLSRAGERFIWIAALGMVLIVAIALAFSNFRRAPNASQTMRFFITPTDQAAFINSSISPDGRILVINGRDSSGKTFLLIRSLDSLSTQPLSGTDDAAYPFWSPDSRSIAFFAGGKLKKIDVTGGPPQTLCDLGTGGGAGGAWNRDRVIVFARDHSSGLYRVSAAGGIATALTALDQAQGEISHKFPQFLPDGKHFLYLAQNAKTEDSSIYVRAIDSTENTLILKTRAQAAYVPDGYLLFLRDQTLMSQPFDVSKLQLTGEPAPLAEQVGFTFVPGFANFSVSDNGVLTYMSGGSITGGQPFLFDRDGKSLGPVGPTGNYFNIYLSPDEKRVAASMSSSQSGARDIWLLDIARNTPTRFTFDPAEDAIPIWSPDGSRIAFYSDRDGPGNLYEKSANGASNEELLLKTNERKFLHDWSRDGKFIAYSNQSQSTNIDLWVLPMTGDKNPVRLLQSPFNEDNAKFSPDGHFIAYSSDESGRFEVYVQTFPVSGGKWLISRDGGAQPRWRRDGKEIFFIAPDKKLMAADVKLESNFDVSVPKPLFQTQIAGYTTPRNGYDVFGNGQRFLIVTTRQETNFTPITIVTNWTAGLKR